MAILGMGPGEKGVSGVPGPPAVLVVPADVLFMMRELVLMGVMMLEEPDVSDDFDCELESGGCGLAALGALSLLENRPISETCVRVRRCSGLASGCDRPVTGGLHETVCWDSITRNWTCARDAVGREEADLEGDCDWMKIRRKGPKVVRRGSWVEKLPGCVVSAGSGLVQMETDGIDGV
jgi:hypothetical protein